MPFRLAIADAHDPVRFGIRKLVDVTDIQLVAEAINGQDAIELAFRYMPDIFVTEIRFPDMHGVDVVATLREKLPSLPIVVFTSHDNPTYAARVALHGVNEYVLKTNPIEELLNAIDRARTQQPAPEHGLVHRVRDLMSRRRPEFVEDFPLTQREFQVMRHVALGLSNREIGRSLKISIETVKEHVQNILRKIDAADRTQAAVWAVKRGLAQY